MLSDFLNSIAYCMLSVWSLFKQCFYFTYIFIYPESLIDAIKEGQIKTVKALIAAGADSNMVTLGYMPIHLC